MEAAGAIQVGMRLHPIEDLPLEDVHTALSSCGVGHPFLRGVTCLRAYGWGAGATGFCIRARSALKPGSERSDANHGSAAR